MPVNDMPALEFMVHLRNRRGTLKRSLRLRIRNEDFPQHDDLEVKELDILRRYARLLKLPLELN